MRWNARRKLSPIVGGSRVIRLRGSLVVAAIPLKKPLGTAAAENADNPATGPALEIHVLRRTEEECPLQASEQPGDPAESEGGNRSLCVTGVLHLLATPRVQHENTVRVFDLVVNPQFRSVAHLQQAFFRPSEAGKDLKAALRNRAGTQLSINAAARPPLSEEVGLEPEIDLERIGFFEGLEDFRRQIPVYG